MVGTENDRDIVIHNRRSDLEQMIGMYEREKRLGNGDRKRSGWGIHDRDGRGWNNGVNCYRVLVGSEKMKERVKSKESVIGVIADRRIGKDTSREAGECDESDETKKRKEPAVVKVNGIRGSGFERNGKRVKNDGGNKKGKERDAQPVRDQGEAKAIFLRRNIAKRKWDQWNQCN